MAAEPSGVRTEPADKVIAGDCLLGAGSGVQVAVSRLPGHRCTRPCMHMWVIRNAAETEGWSLVLGTFSFCISLTKF